MSQIFYGFACLITVFFLDQAVHSFQLRLLRSEISQANADRAKASGNLVKAREVVRRGIDEKWWPSVIFYLNRKARSSVNNLISRHKRKLEKFSETQDRLLKNWFKGQLEF